MHVSLCGNVAVQYIENYFPFVIVLLLWHQIIFQYIEHQQINVWCIPIRLSVLMLQYAVFVEYCIEGVVGYGFLNFIIPVC